VFLSGGVDSSMVTASMARLHDRRVQSFAVGYDDPEADERGWARVAAHAIGTEHHEVLVGASDVLAELPAIVRRLDEPVADTAALPLYFLSRVARQHVKVVLSGEGGDEAFAGYVAYARQLAAERVRPLAGALAPLLPLALPGRLGRALRMAALPLERAYTGVARALDAHQDAAAAALA